MMFRDLFREFPRNLAAVVNGRNLLWHLAAIALTALLVLSGLDWRYYQATRDPMLHPLVWFAGIGGFFAPVIIPVLMYAIGEYARDRKMMLAGAAIAQSAIIASIIAAIYKALTGRVPPDFMYSIGATDITREFHLGILHNGVFWGWPSSHAAVAFAGAVALLLMYRNRPLALAVLAYAAFIALGASIGFHWLSDVLAGAIIGSVVGAVVARSFRNFPMSGS